MHFFLGALRVNSLEFEEPGSRGYVYINQKWKTLTTFHKIIWPFICLQQCLSVYNSELIFLNYLVYKTKQIIFFTTELERFIGSVLL